MYKADSLARAHDPFHRDIQRQRQRINIALRRSVDMNYDVVLVTQLLPKWRSRVPGHNLSTNPTHAFFVCTLRPAFLFCVEMDFTTVAPCLIWLLSFTFASEFA